jgi:hypothetical protein
MINEKKKWKNDEIENQFLFYKLFQIKNGDQNNMDQNWKKNKSNSCFENLMVWSEN